MAKHTVTFTADGDKEVCKVKKPRHADIWAATLIVYGTFGSGTAKLQVSPDGGTTKIDAKDVSGTVVTSTVNDVRSIPTVGNGDNNDDYITFWVNLSGSTNPNLIVEIWDNT